ncbi:MAG: Rrf2 family transcriptional regulator [Armatimonadetes bacterium]|nr:Rrf2 family transcriptional regulator [Armatimonadota bacterium]
MQRSRRFEYALLAVIDLAVEAREGRVQLHEIAGRHEIPEKYLEQLLRPLKAAGLVISARGSRGGYQLGRPAGDITVLEILEAVEGPLDPDGDRPTRSPGVAVIDLLWSEVTGSVRDRLSAVTLRRHAAMAVGPRQRRGRPRSWPPRCTPDASALHSPSSRGNGDWACPHFRPTGEIEPCVGCSASCSSPG